MVLPQFDGGTNWGGASFDPETATLYVNASNAAESLTMVECNSSRGPAPSNSGEEIDRLHCSSCHGADRQGIAPAPSLTALRQAAPPLSRNEALVLLENGRGQMPSFSQLGDDEKKGLIEYLFQESGWPPGNRHILSTSSASGPRYLSTGHQPFLDPEGYPANKPPWGTLTAIQLARGEIRWQIPLGEYPELIERWIPPTGTFNMGGSFVTAGGLVFIAAAKDEKFRAFDKETGQLLW